MADQPAPHLDGGSDRRHPEPGVVQPHGALLALDAGCRRVVGVSANSAAMLGLSVDEVLGADVADVLGQAAADEVRAAADGETLGLPDACAGRAARLAGEVDVTVHRAPGHCTVEIEPAPPVTHAVPAYRQARGATLRLAREHSVEEIAARLAQEVGLLAGYDQVGVHRLGSEAPGLLAEWTSAHVADPSSLPSTGDGLAPHLGHATSTRARLIADVAGTPVPMRFADGTLGAAGLDLTRAILAGAPPCSLDLLRSLGVTAAMSVDLVIDGQVWGVVVAHHHSGPHRPGHDVRSAVEFLTRASAQLLAERQRADLLAARSRTEQILTALMTRTSDSASKAMGVLIEDRSLAELMDAGGAALCFDNVISTQGAVPDDAALRRIAQLLRRDDGQAEWTSRLADLDEELAAVAGVAAGAMVIGSTADRWMMWVRPQDQDEQSAPWEPWLAEAAVALSNHLAGVLYLHSREQVDLATSLQRSVIPAEAPRFRGLDLAARYLPAATYQLGGDWWDAFELGDGRIALVVGDVAGHGVEAAATMTQLRAAVRAHLFAGESPAAALDRTDLFMDGLVEHVVATAVVGIVDPAAHRISLAAAGHPPPFLVENGRARALEVPTRPLLGLAVSAAHEADFELRPGSTLVLYTDGLVERRGVNLGESIESLGRVAGHGPGPGAAAIDIWVERLLTAVPGERDDDTTLVALRFSR